MISLVFLASAVYIYITTNELCPFPLKLLICHILICFDILLQIGDVSDEELLDLLNLAMSSDAATVVRRAREVLSSKVDPLQLLAQLANLVMDILASWTETVAVNKSSPP